MTSVTNITSRVLAVIGLTVALAVAAPAALAAYDQNGPLDWWQYALVDRSAAEAQQNGPLDPWAYAVIHRGDASGPSMIPATKSESGGMNWGDAGIGAAAVFGLMLLLAGGTIVVRKRTALARPRF
jgi:hypothetical protein